MGLKDLFIKKDPHQESARSLYESAVERARQPVFYSAFEVPDSIDGRFEMIALHVFLQLRRLKEVEGAGARDLAQRLYDLMFDDMDRSLREMGVGDLGVGKRVKRMAQALAGRVEAYDAGLAASDETLEGALKRNLYGTHDAVSQTSLAAMVAYLRGQSEHLARQDDAAALSGRIVFAEPPRGS